MHGKVRGKAAVATLAIAGSLLAACNAHPVAKAPPAPTSVLISRPNTTIIDGYLYHGRLVSIQAFLRGGGHSPVPPVLTEKSKVEHYFPSKSDGLHTLVGSSKDGCHPLDKPLPVQTVEKALAGHPVVRVAYDSLPKLAQESVMWVTTKGDKYTIYQKYPVYTPDFLLRGVRVGSATAATETYRVGPKEPGVLLDQVGVGNVGQGWQPADMFPVIISLARC